MLKKKYKSITQLFLKVHIIFIHLFIFFKIPLKFFSPLIIEMNKTGRPKGSKNTPRRTLDLRDFIPEPEPIFKITSSQRKLLKTFNPDGLPDFRTKEFKKLSYDEKDSYIAEQLQIAIENRNNEKEKQLLNYFIINPAEFPNKDYRDYIDNMPLFYRTFKKYKGHHAVMRYYINKEIIFTENLNIPLKNYGKWWKDYSKYGYGIFNVKSEEITEIKYRDELLDYDFKGNIAIYNIIYRDNKKNELLFKKQFFKEHKISNCLLEPIKLWAIDCKEKAQSKSTYYRYKKIEEDINEYLELYLNSGVPQDEIINICNKLKIDISISLPLEKQNKFIDIKSNSKALKTFKFINTKFNHIDLDEVVLENKFIQLEKYKDLINIRENLIDNDKFYIYKMNNNKYTSIISNDGHYKIKDDFQLTIADFEIETGLDNCKICDIEDFELSKFVRNSCHYNNSINFIENFRDKIDNTIDYNYENSYLDLLNDEIYEIINLEDIKINYYYENYINHIDMKKAYANFKSCLYYQGFLGKITDFRKTDKIIGIGLYQINNLDFSNCEEKLKKLLLKLNVYHNNYIYSSPELQFLKDNEIKFNIICGAWGHSSFDFDFNQDMLNKKTDEGISYYAKWCGFINSQFLNSNYYLKSCKNFNYVLSKYGDCYDAIRYLKETNETIITIKKKNNYHLSHINSFITSYQRLNLIEQLQEINYNDLIRINVDCIYYYGNYNLELKNVFRHKKFKGCVLNDNSNSLISLFDEIPIYKYSNIEVNENYKSKINLGCGGSGKTTKELRDDGLIKKLFCPPSWKLARNKEKEEKVNVSVWYYITTKDPEIRNKILKKYNVLIIDEVSMMTEETKKILLEEFKLCKIIFCGDLGFQLPPIDNKEMTIEGIEKIEYFNNNYRCKCPKLLELLNKCREMIKDKKELNFINNFIIDFFKKQKRIINLEKLKEIYEINDMILSGTNDLKDAYTEIFKGKFDLKKFYITSNNRYYSNGEIFINQNKPEGVQSQERYCYTTHSIQGETAYDKVFIDISKMFDERMFYTALSRAMYLEQIYLIYSPKLITIQKEKEKKVYKTQTLKEYQHNKNIKEIEKNISKDLGLKSVFIQKTIWKNTDKEK